MGNKTREILTVLSLLLLMPVAPIVAECIPLLIVTVLTACALIFVVRYAPERREKKEPKVRPLFTDWDECYLITQNFMQEK